MPVIIVVSTVLGVLTKGTIPVAQTLVSQSLENEDNHEKAFGVHSFFTNIATTVSPILLGVISDTFSVMVAFYVSACFALLAIIPALFFSQLKLRNESPSKL